MSESMATVMDELAPLMTLDEVSARMTKGGGKGKVDGIDPVDERIVWIALGKSGLDVTKDKILEVSVSVTDRELCKMSNGPSVVLYQNEELLESMKQWRIDQHRETGLCEMVSKSVINEYSAEQSILAFLKAYTNKGKCVLAGNSIYMDKMFLAKYMPELNRHLHCTVMDVASLKEMLIKWFPAIVRNVPKKDDVNHCRAARVIDESVKELRYYKSMAFISKHMYTLYFDPRVSARPRPRSPVQRDPRTDDDDVLLTISRPRKSLQD